MSPVLANSELLTAPSYRSGRPAVVLSRKGDGTKGLLTFGFSDSIPQRLLAYFSPSGHMCCYHPSGAIHLLTDKNGGTLYDEVQTQLSLADMQSQSHSVSSTHLLLSHFAAILSCTTDLGVVVCTCIKGCCGLL